MKIPSPAYAIGALGVLAFLGEMNKRGYYGSTFGYGSSNDGSSNDYVLSDRVGSATPRQIAQIVRLGGLIPPRRREGGGMTMREASQLIDQLMAERPARGSRAWKDIPDKYRKMSSSELRNLAASGDSVAAQTYEEKQMAYDAFHAGLAHSERQDERRYGRRA